MRNHFTIKIVYSAVATKRAAAFREKDRRHPTFKYGTTQWNGLLTAAFLLIRPESSLVPAQFFLLDMTHGFAGCAVPAFIANN